MYGHVLGPAVSALHYFFVLSVLQVGGDGRGLMATQLGSEESCSGCNACTFRAPRGSFSGSHPLQHLGVDLRFKVMLRVLGLLSPWAGTVVAPGQSRRGRRGGSMPWLALQILSLEPTAKPGHTKPPSYSHWFL